MRYLDGGTLHEGIAQGLLPLDEVTYLMRQICSALDYAHRQGIVHRDIKPSNSSLTARAMPLSRILGWHVWLRKPATASRSRNQGRLWVHPIICRRNKPPGEMTLTGVPT